MTGNPDGSGRTPFSGNIIPSDRFDDAAMTMLDLVPSANLPGITSNHEVGGQEILNRYNTDIKGDWYRTDADRLWGKYSWMAAQVNTNSGFGLGGGGAIGRSGDGVGDTDVRVYGIGQTWTLSPTFLLDTNFGFTDMDQQVLGQDFAFGNFGQDVLGIPGTNAAEGQAQACIVDGVVVLPVFRSPGTPPGARRMDGRRFFGMRIASRLRRTSAGPRVPMNSGSVLTWCDTR